MKVLVVGSGGREHALCWKLAQSDRIERLYCAPGNAGIADTAECVPIGIEKINDLADFALSSDTDLTIIGPEIPLDMGIVDLFLTKGLKCFGPKQKAAQLEGSKAFAKRFMQKYQIPTARFQVFDDFKRAEKGLKEFTFPVVIKASGLAAGKGVIICQNSDEAIGTLKDILVYGRFAEAGSQVVIEEYLNGEEASILAITDGINYVWLTPSQDHKRLQDGDKGPNTGGMGAYAPAPIVTRNLQARIEAEIIQPTLRGMHGEGIPFTGCLYLGLMITEEGAKVLEYNCRFGDPEAQAVLPMMKSDLFEVIDLAFENRLEEYHIELHSGAAVCVVMASKGYPGKYEKGKEITGLSKIPDGVTVFHAGTSRDKEKFVTNGGRVLGVTARGKTLKGALKLAYKGVDAIHFDEKFYRKDIAYRALNKSKSS